MASQSSATRNYVLVFAALMILTVLTVAVSFIEMGPFHLMVALLIAVAKAVLVGLFFMHLWESKRLLWLAAVAGFFWLAIMLGLTLTDYLSRDWLGHPLPGLNERDVSTQR